MLEIENWSKERVYTVMRELLFSFNYMWFLMEDWIKQNCPEKINSKDLQKVSETFGTYEAKRLEKTVNEKKEGIDRLIQFLDHSHWRVFEDIDLTKLSDRQLRMRTFGCTAQKAAKKWGMECYNCSEPGFRLRQGFFAQINPTAQVTRIYTPPDERPTEIPKEVSCEWRISIQ
jgi:transcription termination factor NusB